MKWLVYGHLSVLVSPSGKPLAVAWKDDDDAAHWQRIPPGEEGFVPPFGRTSSGAMARIRIEAQAALEKEWRRS